MLFSCSKFNYYEKQNTFFANFVVYISTEYGLLVSSDNEITFRVRTPNLDTHLTWTVDALGLVIPDLSNRPSLFLDYFLKFAYPVDEIEVVNSAS